MAREMTISLADIDRDLDALRSDLVLIDERLQKVGRNFDFLLRAIAETNRMSGEVDGLLRNDIRELSAQIGRLARRTKKLEDNVF